MSDRSGDVVDFRAAKRRLGASDRVPCPRCGRRVEPDAGRCPHCSIWFAGEAGDHRPRLDWRGRIRVAVRWAFWALVAALAAIGAWATLFAP